MPQNVYDDPGFFAGYRGLRRSREGLAGAPEWPTLQSMLPAMPGLRVLDLGCGFGAFTRWARTAGAASVIGVDLSENMLAQARTSTQDPGITYLRSAIEDLTLPAASFDLVYSSLALHYILDFAAVCSLVRHVLVRGGSFAFSVEHPLYTAPSRPGWQTDAAGNKTWPVDSYLLEGPRTTNWFAPGVVKQHRTLASYVNGLVAASFRLVRLEEWGPTAEQIAEWPDLAEELQRPTFLLAAAILD